VQPFFDLILFHILFLIQKVVYTFLKIQIIKAGKLEKKQPGLKKKSDI